MVAPGNFGSDATKRGDAAEDFVSEGAGLSLYRCSSDDEVSETAVALSNKRNYEKHFDFIKILEEDFQAAGVELDHTKKGETGVEAVDCRHSQCVDEMTHAQALLIVNRVLDRDGQHSRVRKKALIEHAERLEVEKGWSITVDWLKSK